MTEKAWTLAEEEELHKADARVRQMMGERERSMAKVHADTLKFVDSSVPSHELDIRGIADFIAKNRWALLDILSEGRYSAMIAIIQNTEENND